MTRIDNSIAVRLPPCNTRWPWRRWSSRRCRATVAALPGGGCPHGDIANPYWDSPPQALVNTGQNFPTYDTFPGALGLAAQGFGSPYVGSLIVNYKHQKFAITPSLQFQGGGKYGVPIAEAGIDPASGCGKPLVGDRYNATSCPGVVLIPDPFTGVYDPIGAFTQPNELIANLQLSYEPAHPARGHADEYRQLLLGRYASGLVGERR